MPTKLDEKTVKKKVAPARGAVSIWDSEVKGFGLRVYAPTPRHPEGAKAFFMNYRTLGVERRLTIGEYPTWTALAARVKAKALRKEIDSGGDPARERREAREAPTVADLAERYRREHLPSKAPRSQVGDLAMIANEILPVIGERKVTSVHFGDIKALHEKITARGAMVHANRVLAVASAMFELALRPMAGEDAAWRDQAQGNPCRGVKRNQEQGKERFFSATEILALTDALTAYGETSASNCLRLIMLTGARPGEAMRATWAEFAEPGFWDKPSAHTKQRRRHRIPLSPGATEFVERLRVKGGRESDAFVFPGQKKGTPLTEIRTAWEAVARAAGVTDARAYDLRHTFASIGAGGGLSLQIIGRLLGHTKAATTQRYAHLADDPLREAAAKIGAAIAGAGKDAGNVVTLPSRGGK
jgi:integrase